MDLDKLKEAWQQTKLEPNIQEEKIRRMLDNKGKSAFNFLYRYEILGLIISILCIPLVVYVLDEYITTVFLICTVIVLIIWQVYKIYYLSKIDLQKMGILEISYRIAKYRRFVSWELTGVIIWITVFSILSYFILVYIRLYDYLPFSRIIYISLAFLAIIAGGIILSVFLYKIVYIKNIKSIEESIQEVKEYERDNNE